AEAVVLENPVADARDRARCSGKITGQTPVLSLQSRDAVHNPRSATLWVWYLAARGLRRSSQPISTTRPLAASRQPALPWSSEGSCSAKFLFSTTHHQA